MIVGNTTMQTLLVGMSPAGLGVSPYLPVIRDALKLRAEEIALDLIRARIAINQVDIEPTTRQPKCTVIGGEDGARPLGICGSGLLDAMAAMYRAGILTTSGRLNEDAAGVICDRSGLGLSYLLVSAEQSGTGQAIVISQQDVRAFQLAKAALATGIEVLMEQCMRYSFLSPRIITRVDSSWIFVIKSP